MILLPFIIPLCLVAADSAIASSASSRSATGRLAIYPLQPLGTEMEIADRLDAVLRAEVKKLRGVELQDRTSTQRVLEMVEGPQKRCKDHLDCMAHIGRQSTVNWLVYGTVATLGDSYTLDLKLLEVASGTVVNRVSEQLSGDKDVLISGVCAIATKLIAPEQYLGTVELTSTVAGALVVIDAKEVGTTPLNSLQLQPGQHSLRVSKKNYHDFDHFFEVKFAHTTVVDVVLQEMDSGPSPLESPQVLAGVGTGVAGTAVFIGGVTLMGLFWASYFALDSATEPRGADGERVVVDAESYRNWRNQYQEWQWPMGLLLTTTGLAVIGTGAGMIYLELNKVSLE